MKLNNSEFVKRHFSENKLESSAPPKPKRKVSLTVIFASLTFLFVTLCFFVLAMTVAQSTLLTALMMVAGTLSAIIGFGIVRAIREKAVKERDYDLIQEVLEGSRGARLITDTANNTVYFNKKFERLCRGVGPTSLKTLTRLFVDNEESRLHFETLAQQAQRGITDSIELFSKYEDAERWFMVTGQPVSGYSGYVHWRIDDVTQQHTIDRAIREEREKLIDFTDNAPVGFFSVDENGKFVFANATFARWVGEDIRTLLTNSTLHTYLVDPPEGTNPYDLTAEESLRQVVEIRMKGTAGKTFLASINQVVVIESDGRVRTRAVVRDLTAEREMRKALEASEDRFQRFFEEAPLGIIQVDENGMISDCNHAFADMIKVSIEDIQNTEFEALISERDLEKVMHEIGRIGNGQDGDPLEITMEDKHGNPITAQMYARKFKGSHSTVLHFIDITERKSLEAQFVQSQKMQAIGQLAGGVAHDFNNLLTAIIGYCDLLILRHKPGDPSFADIKQVEQNAQRAAALVKQLLAFSRQQTLQPKIHDMSDILTEVSHLLRRLLGVSIDLDLIHGAGLALVKVDEGQMEQVLINLAVNARDAMEGKGSLIIETENYTNKETIELISEDLPAGDWVRIKVTDTGCGISENNLTRIFEPFFTTKKVGEGTGLGLATVYGIVRQTGGYLDVQSELGKGTIFTLYLPQASETDQKNAKTVETVVEDSMQDLTGSAFIFLVEDEDAVRTFSERALANKGYEVASAESGDKAWEMFESGEIDRIDLMITDVVMPGMDGPSLVKKIREVRPDLKVIFMSGYTEDRLKDHQSPITYFLPKPFKLNQLAAKVKEVLNK
jgi:two-component system cell cycle sensor histidine kinase/response regulator CckA